MQNKEFECKLQATVECNQLGKLVITRYIIFVNGNILIETEKDNITRADHYSNFWFMLDEKSRNIFTEMRLAIDSEFVVMQEKHDKINDTYTEIHDTIESNMKPAESVKCNILLLKLHNKIALSEVGSDFRDVSVQVAKEILKRYDEGQEHD